jgi:uncharacterized protein (TIGR02453 family)
MIMASRNGVNPRKERLQRRAAPTADAPGRMVTSPRFSPKSLAFLRALKRNNDREWFKARREQYDLLLRDPMVAVIERLGADLRTFAPSHLASPSISLYRIYRDTRFSQNKAPLKTHIAAVFPRRELGRHAGASLYLEVTPGWVWAGGGLYAPDASQLQAVREHIAGHPRELRAIVESRSFLRVLGPMTGEQLQRVPRGFPKDHAAADYLKHRQFLAGREFPAAFAYSPKFYSGIVNVFKQVAPLAEYLNEPLLQRESNHLVF